MKEYKSKAQKKQFYDSSAWAGKKGIRQQALKRDNWECQQCKVEGYVHLDSEKVIGERKSVELNVHHIKEIEDHPELALTLDNTVTLCLRHHNAIHGKGFKPKIPKYWNEERW